MSTARGCLCGANVAEQSRAPGAVGRHVWVECVNPDDGLEYILDPSLFTVMLKSQRKQDEYVERVLDFEKRIIEKMLSDALKAAP